MQNSFDENIDKPDSINMKLFQNYIDEHGTDRAKGFVDAMEFMMHHLDFISVKQVVLPHESYYVTDHSPNRVRTKLIDFKETTKVILKDVKRSEMLNGEKTARLEDPEIK